MRLIDADALLKKTINNPSHAPYIVEKDIREMPTAQPEPQWIPVSERLPEESEYCIITANDGVGRRTTFAKFQKKAKSWDLTGARSYWRVIAWMPLPEPYGKEDGQDEQT